MRQLLAAACLLLVAAGCANREEVAARLKSAATSDRLPKVVACWEAAFEAAGYRGQFVALVDFDVGSDGTIRSAAVRDLEDQTEESAAFDTGAFRSCVEAALNESRLDPGLSSGGLKVTSFRIAFGDVSKKAREAASENAPTLLIGPRADRCQGLYGHDPPRDAAQLHKLLEQALDEASRTELLNIDRHARAMQKGYDLALELDERLKLELGRQDLPSGSRERLEAARDNAQSMAREVGSRIGCAR